MQIEVQQQQCRVCKDKFVHSGQFVCPSCGTGPRERRMVRALRDYLEIPECGEEYRILEVGPTPSSTRLLTQDAIIGQSQYVAIDIELGQHLLGLAAPHLAFEMDVCQLEFTQSQFDIVICNHVLAFVSNYRDALDEVFRVLKPTGVAFLQTALPLEKTTAAQISQSQNPELFTPDVLENVGTQWLFGRDFFNILRQFGFIPLRYRVGADEFLMAFKSIRSPFFSKLSHLRAAHRPVRPIEPHWAQAQIQK